MFNQMLNAKLTRKTINVPVSTNLGSRFRPVNFKIRKWIYELDRSSKPSLALAFQCQSVQAQ